MKHIKQFKKYFYLLTILVKRDIKKKYKGSILGILWSLLSPLVQLVLLTIIFSTLFNTSIENFPLYVIVARLIFEFFSTATNSAMYSIIESADLLKKVYIPKFIITLSRVLSNFIILMISLIDLLIIMLVTKADFSITLLLLPIYLFFLLLFTIGICYILATVATFFRDIVHLYSVFIMMLMFASAIFYPADIVPQKYFFILELNPVYRFIASCREIVVGVMPGISDFFVCLLLGVGTLILGSIIFESKQNKLISRI